MIWTRQHELLCPLDQGRTLSLCSAQQAPSRVLDLAGLNLLVTGRAVHRADAHHDTAAQARLSQK